MLIWQKVDLIKYSVDKLLGRFSDSQAGTRQTKTKAKSSRESRERPKSFVWRVIMKRPSLMLAAALIL